MFKNLKLEARLVNTKARANKNDATEEEPTLDAVDYALIAEEAAVRLGTKLIIGTVVLIATTAVIAVLANAADTALQNTIISE
jgi:hypothetical protein